MTVVVAAPIISCCSRGCLIKLIPPPPNPNPNPADALCTLNNYNRITTLVIGA